VSLLLENMRRFRYREAESLIVSLIETLERGEGGP